MKLVSLLGGILLAALPCFPQNPSAKPAPKITYIKAGTLFDSTSNEVKHNMVIVVADDRIQKVGAASEIAIPADASVIDLNSDTVVPGLIDCHTHITGRADKYDPINSFRDSPFDHAIAGVVNARRT